MSLPEAVSNAFRALRKYDLAPLGAILVVVILAAGVYLTLTTNGSALRARLSASRNAARSASRPTRTSLCACAVMRSSMPWGYDKKSLFSRVPVTERHARPVSAVRGAGEG